jgi:hypothetical protein
MTTRRNALAGAFLAALMVAAVPAIADDAGRKAAGVAEASARTGGNAVRDGFLTFGRTVKSFFTGGPNAARETWRENAAETRENARENANAVRGEANR